MFSLMIALTALGGAQAAAPATPATPAVPVAAPARTLASIPGVTIKYYDIVGNNAKEVEKALKAARPAGTDGRPIPASTSWSAKTQVSKATTEGVCKITAAKVTFTGTAELPRLASTAPDPAFMPHWKTLTAQLEADSAADLGYIYDRTGELEKAVLGAPCETAGAALDAVTNRLKAQVSAIAAQRSAARAEAAKAQAKQKKQRPRLI